MPSRSIVIVGSGVFGVTAALALGDRGWTVSLMDAAEVPATTAASTDISKVVRSDYGADRLYTDMADAALLGWERWNARWGTDLYHQDGFLVLAGETMRPGGFEYESFALLEARGHAVERLEPATRSHRFPAWALDRYPDGYFNARAGWVESGAVVARLIGDARAAGVRLLEHTRVARLLERGTTIAGVVAANGDEVRADVVLVAAGAWTPTLLPYLGNVLWAIGQPVVHLAAPAGPDWRAPAFPVWAADIARTGWYGFPALADGTLKIGHHGAGRRVHPDEPRVVLPAEQDNVRDFLRDSLPGLAQAPILASRLCLYCDSFDGDFWIDHDPDRPGLVVAAGDSGHAFKFAPILGGLIADVVERAPNAAAARFRWRRRVRDAKEAARFQQPGRVS